MDLSIIIPCYNEHDRGLSDVSNQTLEYRLSKLKSYLSRLSYIEYEVIFVNDGSTDNTLNILKDFISKNNIIRWKVLSYSKNKGKGYAIKRGINYSNGSYILFMDADLSVPLDNILVAIKSMSSTSCIIGDRYLRSSMSNRKLSRKVISFFARGLIKPLIKSNGIDTQCGFKLFPRDAISTKIDFCKSDRWLLDVELLMIFESTGLDILALPVEWNNMAKSTIGLKAVISSIKELISIYIRRDFLIEVGEGRIMRDKVK